MARSRSRPRYGGAFGPSMGSTYELKRRRDKIYRDTRKLREATDAAERIRRDHPNDLFTQGLYDGRMARARRQVMEDWDALRRREAREQRLHDSFVDPKIPVGGAFAGDLRSRYPQGALFDPTASYLTKQRHPLHEPTRKGVRSHSHAHRDPSHHVGPCDWGCRFGGRSHEHRSRRYLVNRRD